MWRKWKMILLLRVYIEECAGSHSVGRQQKRWLDNVKDCLKKRGRERERERERKK